MTGYNLQDLLEKNRAYLWNPFTQMKGYLDEHPVVIESGEGRKLRDVEGNEYWDGVSSLWLNVHGHRVPELDDAIRRQLDRIAHSTLLGMANVPALQLAERLVRIAPRGLAKVFYSDSGAEAVEIALKMAFQYWQNRGYSNKTSFLTMREAYHGDTIGAVSVGAIDLFHKTYSSLLFPSLKVPYPRFRPARGAVPPQTPEDSMRRVEEVLAGRSGELAALIVEPVQGAGGIIPMPDGFLAELRRLCTQHSVLMIVDEVATGFGRTGRMFACEHDSVTPDIMAVAKGITGGYLPLAATLVTDEVYSAFYADYEEQKTFYHGHSYTGNPLACAAALANLELIERSGLIESVARKAGHVARRMEPLHSHPHVGEVRQKGLMVGVELVMDKSTGEPYPERLRMGARVCRRCRELGLLLRPLSDVVVFMPPLASTESELDDMIDILFRALADVGEPGAAGSHAG